MLREMRTQPELGMTSLVQSVTAQESKFESNLISRRNNTENDIKEDGKYKEITNYIAMYRSSHFIM